MSIYAFQTITAAPSSIDAQRAFQRKVFTVIAFLLLCWLMLSPSVAHAAMPWEDFSQKLACSLSGPWVKWLAVIAVALGGIMFGLGELSGPFQRVMQIVGGFSIAAGATAAVALIFGGSSMTC